VLARERATPRTRHIPVLVDDPLDALAISTLILAELEVPDDSGPPDLIEVTGT
jgi:hypothetical protein